MARYYEETALIEFVKERTPTINGETTMECVERAIREAPTADVVPKSEVEALKHEIERIIDEGEYWQGKLLVARSTVAREIFEEIDDLDIQLNNGDLDIKYFGSAIAELKKKYTESEDKE